MAKKFYFLSGRPKRAETYAPAYLIRILLVLLFGGLFFLVVVTVMRGNV